MTQVLDRVRNGVDSEQLYGTLDAIKANPELGIFQFRARNHWIDGSHNRHVRSTASTAPARRTSRARSRSSSTPASRRSCSARTPAPTRPSTCCTPSPPA